MELKGKATRLWSDFHRLDKPQIRAFHLSWFAFFLCFFAWFGIAPLMPIVRDELGLTAQQIGWTIVASVAITVLARLFIGWACDRYGPRLAYSGLLVFCAFPVMGIGLAQSFETFLIARLLIGVIGASFVITQYHTSIMFAPNLVGTANATSAGWGNLGGGVTQFAMPVVFAFFVTILGFSEAVGWRLAMVSAGVVCLLVGIAYFFFTQDAPEGNYRDLRARGKLADAKSTRGTFRLACKDHRVWALAIIYAACFGIELTINNVAALYFADYFGMGLTTAGIAAACFGLMNIFARTLGGMFGDRFGLKWGLKGRVTWLFIALFAEGIALMFFSQMTWLPLAIATLIVFSLFCQMAEGATFAVVPFVNKKALGSISGIVGAGGNVGAVSAGFLFAGAIDWSTALLILGALVTCCSFLAFAVRFSPAMEREAWEDLQGELARSEADDENAPAGMPLPA
ncbi:MFS transporter [Phycisphaerales bacterium AB-hyl4]|uniref:MFS transporter n=1 Tax=Natronomicrosphaera hydrolytica TaxID=3242702 RepID=A0ABV4U9T6_9BACT